MAGTSVQRALKFLGYESLRPEQEAVVWEFLSGKNVFLALPMGYSKSCLFAIRFDIASFPGHRPASRRTASDGKLGEGLGTRLLLTTETQRRMDCYKYVHHP